MNNQFSESIFFHKQLFIICIIYAPVEDEIS